MQRVTCTVRLSGDNNNTVEKSGVSPAEIVILNDIHGEGAVVNIRPNSMDKESHVKERARLVNIYGVHVVDRIFPGEFNKLPVTLAELKGEEPAEDEDADEADADAKKADADTDADTDANDDDAGAEEDEDDKILRESVASAKTKAELYDIAKVNGVDLENIEDKMDPMRSAILNHVFGKAE